MKRYYIRKPIGSTPEENYEDERAVIDRVYDKTVCRCNFVSDATKIKKALNANEPELSTNRSNWNAELKAFHKRWERR